MGVWEIELSSFYTYRFTVMMMTKNNMNRYKGYRKSSTPMSFLGAPFSD